MKIRRLKLLADFTGLKNAQKSENDVVFQRFFKAN